jgi:hypothetical protein
MLWIEWREERRGGLSQSTWSLSVSVLSLSVSWNSSLEVTPRLLLKFGSLYPCGALGVLLGCLVRLPVLNRNFTHYDQYDQCVHGWLGISEYISCCEAVWVERGL